MDDKSYLQNKNKEEKRKEIIRLGVKYQIATTETSFVAVNERETALETAMIQSTIPSTISNPEMIGIEYS